MPTSSELRAAGRRSLTGYWWNAVGLTLIYSLILGLVGSIPGIGWIGVLLLGGPLTFAMYVFFLRLYRGERPLIGSLFDGFSRYAPTMALYLLMYVLIILWSLLLVVPGIIAALRYSQAYFIMQDDATIGPQDAIERSKEMMYGHKWRLFVLYVSFIGWALLSAITFGIGSLWLVPYMLASQAAFYEDLKSRSS
ncbi:DUF975 family protein [Paenibacillus sp. GCM10012303]|uniref:DUF975 family protein n=1 Tax=Paenibacillus sp. GCM10012303 TaxID=3317340 RepID=UPI003623A14E